MITAIKIQNNKLSKATLNDFKSKNIAWLDVLNPSKEEIKHISKITKFPLDEIEMALDEEERPRIVEMFDHTLLIFRAPFEEHGKTSTTSIAIFFSEYNIITMHRHEIKAIERINKLSSDVKKNMLQDTSYFLYRLLDEIINTYFSIMDKVEDDIDYLEDKVFHNPEHRAVKDIFEIKKTLIYFHKAFAAGREVIVEIEKEYIHRIKKKYVRQFRNLYNDLTQLIDMEGTYRDVITGILDLYLSSISNNLNVIMKKLTAYASLILVPTLISGIYGMNFRWMPELYWQYGYFFALGLMLLSVTLLYIFFKRKEWF